MAASPGSSALTIAPLPAFNDNYIWLLVRAGEAAVVDPGDAGPVRRALELQGLRLSAILVTHHHGDHVGGVMELKDLGGATVYGPARENIPGIDHPLAGGASFEVLGTRFVVIDVPGHTAGHIA
jgi:hydroxyacylglutathione hydrolase